MAVVVPPNKLVVAGAALVVVPKRPVVAGAERRLRVGTAATGALERVLPKRPPAAAGLGADKLPKRPPAAAGAAAPNRVPACGVLVVALKF